MIHDLFFRMIQSREIYDFMLDQAGVLWSSLFLLVLPLRIESEPHLLSGGPQGWVDPRLGEVELRFGGQVLGGFVHPRLWDTIYQSWVVS